MISLLCWLWSNNKPVTNRPLTPIRYADFDDLWMNVLGHFEKRGLLSEEQHSKGSWLIAFLLTSLLLMLFKAENMFSNIDVLSNDILDDIFINRAAPMLQISYPGPIADNIITINQLVLRTIYIDAKMQKPMADLEDRPLPTVRRPWNIWMPILLSFLVSKLEKKRAIWKHHLAPPKRKKSFLCSLLLSDHFVLLDIYWDEIVWT